MITELRGSHLLLALGYMNFKLKETGKIATTIGEKVAILSKLTNFKSMVLFNIINNNEILSKTLLGNMKKANLKIPNLEKISITQPNMGALGKSFVSATLDVLTKAELIKANE